MKNIMIALAISFFAAFNVSANDSFLWADDEDYEPFMYKRGDQEIKGIFRDLMVEIFRRMDVPLEYKVYSWKRTQKMVEAGKADAMITVPTEERLTFLAPTDAILFDQHHIFVRRDNPRIKEIMAITSIEELRGFKIVNYIGAGWAENKFKGLTVEWAPNYTSAILMLARKRADVFIEDSIVVKYRIKSLINEKDPSSSELRTIIESPHALEKLPFSLLIRKSSAYIGIIPKFNKTLEEIKQDGTYKKILDSYIE